MTRRCRCTQGRALLWQDTADGDMQPGEVRDNPRNRPCRWCHAAIGDPCTVRKRHGRRPMTGYHHARQEAP